MPLRTPLYEAHASAGATFIEFGGWEMPLQYAGIVAEHLAVRQAAGLFDVSHMGKILVAGPTAHVFLNRLSTNEISVKPSRSRYTHFLDEEGRVLDDVIVTCLDSSRFLVVCNAGPRERIVTWMRAHADRNEVLDATSDFLCLALQGPKAARVLQLLTLQDLERIKRMTGAFIDLLLGERLGTVRPGAVPPETVGRASFERTDFRDVEDFCFVTRTGYTGEDGFELFPPKELAVPVWNAILEASREAGIQRAGLGARDTLRLEKGFLLSGTDFEGRETPLECASEWVVKWDREFIGREALRRQRESGKYERLVGLVLQEKGVPRHGCSVAQHGRSVGAVTSGTMSPSLKVGIALARVKPEVAAEGTEVAVVVRDRALRAVVKKPPFV